MKLRTKLFLGLLAVQTFAMLVFLVLSFHKVYSKHLTENFSYTENVFSYIEKDVSDWMMYSDSQQIDEYLQKLKLDLSLARTNILQNVVIKNQFDETLAIEDFLPQAKNRHGLVPLVVTSILGDYSYSKEFQVMFDGQNLGSIDITVSNATLINSTINFVRIIIAIWLLLIVVVSFIYYLILNHLTKNITALNQIIDNLENDKYDMKNIELDNKSDEISQLVNSIRHITSKIVKQTKLNRKLNLQKSILLANISNNMLTPLNAISGAVDLLKINHINQEDYRTIRFIEHSANVLLSQITNILTYMELKESNSRLSYSACMMSDLVYSAFKSAKNSLDDEKDIKMKFEDFDESKVYVKADITKLQMVFANVIENAVDFTKSGYVNVDISAIPVDNKYIRYQICVEDTGVGITEDRLDRIQKSLTYADDENIQTKISGLGLTISNLILKKMRGGITLHSVEGHGTTAVIEVVAEKASISRVL